MESASPSTAQEAKTLGVRIEQDGSEWIAVLPPHPDLKNDEEMGLPAPSEAEALDEARAYRAIEQSQVYKFEYDEKRDVYSVTFGNRTFSGKYLAPTYRDAQKAYAEFINKPEPPAPEPAAEPAPKARKRRAAKGNGQPQTDAEVEPAQRPGGSMSPAIPPDPQISSGIGNNPGQLPPARAEQLPPGTHVDPWHALNERVTRLEMTLIAAATSTAKALEELRKR